MSELELLLGWKVRQDAGYPLDYDDVDDGYGGLFANTCTPRAWVNVAVSERYL